MGQNNHSEHWGINHPQKHHPLFLAKPHPLKPTNCPSPPFLGNLPYILVFQDPPLKVESFSKPQKY